MDCLWSYTHYPDKVVLCTSHIRGDLLQKAGIFLRNYIHQLKYCDNTGENYYTEIILAAGKSIGITLVSRYNFGN